MSNRIKKILTIEQLYQFCQSQNFVRFSSKNSGYQLAVSVPTTFEIEKEIDEAHRGMMKLKFKIFHDGINRNGSKVPHDSAERAMKTIPDRPVLAAIHQLDNGDWDFKAHEMEFIENDDGEIEILYLEKQVGSFSSEPAFWEYDDKLDKNFVCAYAYIPREYTKACEIIERKNGTKNSVELSIDELLYDAKDNCLVLEEFYVSGSTLLGSEPDGTEIGEGMIGSRADIVEFSKEINSAFFSSEEKIIAMLEKIDNKISDISIDKNSKEGGKAQIMDKFNELLNQYGKTVEDITFDYSELSDEELEAKFAELFGETPSEDDPKEGQEDDNADNNDTDDDLVNENEPDNEDDSETNPETDEENFEGNVSEKNQFALSLQDKINALCNLVSVTYEEADNEWYGITVFENPNYVVMHGYFQGRHFKQSYKEENGEFSLVGDRTQVYEQFLTKEEIDALDSMRSEYSALVEYKANVEKAEFETKKKALLDDERFDMIKETDAYKEILNDVDKFSLEELETKLKIVVADYALQSGTFANYNPQKSGKMFQIPSKTVNPISSKYGGIFASNEK